MYYAHLAEDGRTQTVTEHLENTGKICAEFARDFNAEEQGFFIGYVHDIGKCSASFQKRLQGGKIVDHASAGALECAKMDALWAACCVAGHHGGLPDVGNQRNDLPGEPTLFGRLKKALKGGIPAYEVPVSLKKVSPPDKYGKDYLTDSFIIRMLYSCLVDADYLDTEQFMSDKYIEENKGEELPNLLEKLNCYIKPWWKPSNELNQKRCDILKSCIENGTLEKGLYTLTVPTGGGKTVSSMAFALNHAVKHGMKRIIYVIPYTSIIEQTCEVFHQIFGDDNVLEHHSNAVFEVVEGEDTLQYSRVRATENWDAPIVVTTAVQFFESLYANRPAKCRKLHRIANSVVIFDEAQMLPTEQLRPCVAAISKIVTVFESTAVLCTATQPALNDLFTFYEPDIVIQELCPKSSDMFEEFRRVRFKNLGRIDADILIERLSALKQVLCIVNTRKSAQLIFDSLPEEGSYHLSTLMYPAHRREVLSHIRRRLIEGRPCRVVSTSLIEAGVDVDFPAVFREMAGLDSVLQAAGRCNREGKRPVDSSLVTIFEGVSVTPQLLKVNIGAAKEALEQPEADPASLETMDQYFRIYRSLADDTLDKDGVISALESHDIRLLPFRTVAESFRFIESNTKTVYIPTRKSIEYIQQLQRGMHSRKLYRELGQFAVNVYESDYKKMAANGALDELDEESAVLRNPDLYKETTGLEIGVNTDTGLFI